MSLAIFDLDNTLIAGDSDHAWGEYLVENGLIDGANRKEQNDQFYLDYVNGCLDINAFLRFSLAPLAQYSQQDLLKWRTAFIEEKIQPMRLAKADALLSKHREQGDFLLIITATNLFVTEPIAQLLEVDDIIATLPEMREGQYTGNVEGIPSFQDGKPKRLNVWLAEKNLTLENSYFYSDSHNDLPLLNQVTHPIVVDGDPILLKVAKEKGWNCLSLR